MNIALMAEPALFVLQFPPLRLHGSGLRFPCNASGEVALNNLSERVRNNYFLARRGVGRDFCRPSVEAVQAAPAPGTPHADHPVRETYPGIRPRPTAFA